MLRKLSAFTLIELLTVIAVIGILGALIMQGLARTRRKAQQTQCISNLHQLGVGLNLYTVDNQVYPLYAPWIVALGREGLGIDYTKGVWVCPSVLWNSNNFPQNWVPCSYGYNGYGLLDHKFGEITLGLGGQDLKGFLSRPTRDSEVANPGEMMAIGDGLNSGTLFTRDNLEHANRLGNASTRHHGRANVALSDGHVTSPTLAFLDEATSDAALARWNRDNQPHKERLSP